MKSSRKRKIALFGGAFDPPHIGHVAFCRELARQVDFDKIWVLPTYLHPFGKKMVFFNLRLEMCEIAFGDLSGKISIRKDEKDAGGDGFTIDLVRHLIKSFPDFEFTLALGTDNYQVKECWKDFEEIENTVQVRYFGRKGWEKENLLLGVEPRFPEVSSDQVRKSISKGNIPEDLLPPGIAQFIKNNGLYR